MQLHEDDLSSLFALVAAAAYRDDPSEELARFGFETALVAGPSDDLPTRVVVAVGELFAVVAVRGTARFDLAGGPDAWEDWARGWLANLQAGERSLDARLVSGRYDGQLHPGFAEITIAVERAIAETVQSLPEDLPIFLCGHSQGGAVATLLHAPIEELGRSVSGVYVYGSPRVGDFAFQKSYEGPLVRHENSDDFVCLVPPGEVGRSVIEMVFDLLEIEFKLPDVDYRHAGRLKFYHWDGPAHDTSKNPTMKRAMRLASQLAGFGRFRRLIGDHRVPLYIAGVLSRREHFVVIGDLEETAGTAELVQALDPASSNLDRIFNALDVVATERVASPGIYDALEQLTHIGPIQHDEDPLILQKTSLWTTGFLMANEAPHAPIWRLRGSRAVARTLWNEEHAHDEVYSAAVQALYVIDPGADPTRRYLLEGAAGSNHEIARSIATDALEGQPFPFDGR